MLSHRIPRLYVPAFGSTSADKAGNHRFPCKATHLRDVTISPCLLNVEPLSDWDMSLPQFPVIVHTVVRSGDEAPMSDWAAASADCDHSEATTTF